MQKGFGEINKKTYKDLLPKEKIAKLGRFQEKVERYIKENIRYNVQKLNLE
jgi:hypothetical protein